MSAITIAAVGFGCLLAYQDNGAWVLFMVLAFCNECRPRRAS